MHRRQFLQSSSLFSLLHHPSFAISRVLANATDTTTSNPNLADATLGAKVTASSYANDPPWGYKPNNLFGNVLSRGWQSEHQMAGAWIEITFASPQQVNELWVLAEPLPADILGLDIYLLTHSRAAYRAVPQHIRLDFSDGPSWSTALQKVNYFQIIQLPTSRKTSRVRITIEDVWPVPNAIEVGLGKIRVFGHPHSSTFDIIPHSMYSARDGMPLQAATIRTVNPGPALEASTLVVSYPNHKPTTIALEPTPSHSVFEHRIWIPAPFEDSECDFQVTSPTATFCCTRHLFVPQYHCYFDGGAFDFNCTNHNDLGWLDTQANTADYRSSALILPALELMRQFPEFVYTMECTAYLMEFLDRHPEKRDEMVSMMAAKRFVWGASYVELLQLSAGPEKLVRQFYFGRRWLKKTFPGIDTYLYIQTDPPCMTLQMPQILARAGVKYCLLGRFTFGFYRWESPDGSQVLTYGYRYGNPNTLIDVKQNYGWLDAANERAEYYSSYTLPRNFIYDYTSDYLPPQPDLVPYVRRQNREMQDFSRAWNTHFVHDSSRQISPPVLGFTTPDKFLTKLASTPLNIPTLRGDWAFSWAYYDEPSNREALLAGRMAHNQLLAAERLYLILSFLNKFSKYPTSELDTAWRANLWPDHGWGGNRGMITDQVYAASYRTAKVMSDNLLSNAGAELASKVCCADDSQIPIAVYNPLSWPRTDVTECNFDKPIDWQGCTLVDESGNEIPCELLPTAPDPNKFKLVFVASNVPAVGYRSFALQRGPMPVARSSAVESNMAENEYFRLLLGRGGIKSLLDKSTNWDVLRTDKFEGGEVLQFTAPGNAWEDVENVTMDDFDRSGNHNLRLLSKTISGVRTTMACEVSFDDFIVHEHFHLYHKLNRIDIDIEIINWPGTIKRELRVVFPINLKDYRLSYEVPFGTVEIGKDELDMSLLRADSAFNSELYGGTRPLSFREAINWIDASSPDYSSVGCLLASDITVHVLHDETKDPVSYPMLQHVLLSVRKSLAWNPEYWYTQKGDHRYRASILPHGGNWRIRFREAIGFNYPLLSFIGKPRQSSSTHTLPKSQQYLTLEPHNLVLTAMKKAEDDDSIVIRFYEAEGKDTIAQIRLPLCIRSAQRTSIIEENEQTIEPTSSGGIELAVHPWEIVTLRLCV